MEFTPGEHKSNVRSVGCCHGDDRIYSMRRNNICGHGERSKLIGRTGGDDRAGGHDGTEHGGAKYGNRIR